MAKIVKTSEQEQALKQILDDLGRIKTLNVILNSSEAAVLITAGRTKYNPSYDKATVDTLVSDIRKPLVTEVKSLSKKYSIVLDDDDCRILDNKIEPAKEPDLVAEPVVDMPASSGSSEWQVGI